MKKIDISNFKRLTIVGASGVGKTTLAKRIQNEFNFNYIPEGARELLEFTKNDDWQSYNDYTYLLFEQSIFYTHLFYLNTISPPFIADSSILDIIAYCNYKKENADIKNFMLLIEEMFKYNMNNIYDCILFYKNGYKNLDEVGKFIEENISLLLKRKILKIPTYFEINKDDVLIYNTKSIIV